MESCGLWAELFDQVIVDFVERLGPRFEKNAVLSLVDF